MAAPLKLNAENWDFGLQMEIRPPAPLDPKKLIFLRALVDSGRMNRAPAGPPTGVAFDCMSEAQLTVLLETRMALIASRPTRPDSA